MPYFTSSAEQGQQMLHHTKDSMILQSGESLPALQAADMYTKEAILAGITYMMIAVNYEP